jgi:hypothetical protein
METLPTTILVVFARRNALDASFAKLDWEGRVARTEYQPSSGIVNSRTCHDEESGIVSEDRSREDRLRCFALATAVWGRRQIAKNDIPKFLLCRRFANFVFASG